MRTRPASSNRWTRNLATLTLFATVGSGFDAAARAAGSGSLQNGGYATIPGGTGVTSVLGRTFGGDLLVATTLFDSKEVQVQKLAPNGQQTEVVSVPTSGNGQAIAFAGGNLFLANAGTNTAAAYEVQKNAGDTVTLLRADEAPSGGENPTSMVVRRVQTSLGFLAPLLVGGDRIDLEARAGAPSGALTASSGIQSVLGVSFSSSNEIVAVKLNDPSPPELLQPPTPVGARPRKIRFAPEGDFVYVAVAMRTAQQPSLPDEYTITVTDTETETVKTYSNLAGTLGSGSDTSAS